MRLVTCIYIVFISRGLPMTLSNIYFVACFLAERMPAYYMGTAENSKKENKTHDNFS